MSNKRSNPAGGAATTSGTTFQEDVAIWYACLILAEQNGGLFSLANSVIFDGFICETAQPSDDINIGFSNGGRILIQAKSSISLSNRKGSEFNKVIHQFIKQYHEQSISLQDGSTRNVDDRDRFVLAVGHKTSQSVKFDLKKILANLQDISLAERDEVIKSFNKKENEAYKKLLECIKLEWIKRTGNSISDQECLNLIKKCFIQPFDFDHAATSRREVKNYLECFVAINRDQAEYAFLTLLKKIRQFNPNRTGSDRQGLRIALINAGVSIKSSPSYTEDINALKNYSRNRLISLEHLSFIEYQNTKLIIDRPVRHHLANSIGDKDILVIGAPGAGKSAILYQLATSVEGRDIVVIPIDKKTEDLHQIIGFQNGHELPEVLENWTGNGNGLLIIDALDAARRRRNLDEICNTLKIIKKVAPRWKLIASVREYDLRNSRDLQNLFKSNTSTTPPQFSKAEFSKINHVYIDKLSTYEIDQVYSKVGGAKELVQASSSKFQELLKNTFNLRLFIELLGTNISSNLFSAVQSQVELLKLYWDKRVVDFGEREVLSKAVNQMVDSRSLECSIMKLEDASTHRSLDSLLSKNIVLEINGNLPPRNRCLAFSHNILYDYAVYYYWLGVFDDDIVSKLSEEKNHELFLAIRPSMVMAFQKLWFEDKSKFWEQAIALARKNEIRFIGKNIAASVAASEFRNIKDLEWLWKQCEKQKFTGCPLEVLQYFVQAGVINKELEPERYHFYGENAASWARLAEKLSLNLNDNTCWLIRNIVIDVAIERKVKLTENQKLLTNSAGIKLLLYGLQQLRIDFIRIASGAICSTIDSNPDKSIEALKPCLSTKLHENWHETLAELCKHIFLIGKYDVEFALEITKIAFTVKGSYDDQVQIGSRIVPLRFNKKDLLNHLSYSIATAFEKSVSAAPSLALNILFKVLKSEIYKGSSTATTYRFELDSKEYIVRSDSLVESKLRRVYAKEDYNKVYDSFRKYLRDVDVDQFFKLVGEQEINSLSAIWLLYMEVGALRPESIGIKIWEIKTCAEILYSSESREHAAKLLKLIYPHISSDQRNQIESTILSIPKANTCRWIRQQSSE